MWHCFHQFKRWTTLYLYIYNCLFKFLPNEIHVTMTKNVCVLQTNSICSGGGRCFEVYFLKAYILIFIEKLIISKFKPIHNNGIITLFAL